MRVLFGITGSVAAHRGLEAARLLAKRGHVLRVILTEAAREFVRPLAFRVLAGECYTDDDFFARGLHIELSEWAHVPVVAPATGNLMAQLATGRADDLLSAVLLAMGPPGIIAPAMHESMWLSPRTQENARVLTEAGYALLGPVQGDLAGGRGMGRMVRPEAIVEYIDSWARVRGALSGKRVIVAYGPTAEPMDPVRVITNLSSGKMGVELARALVASGASVTAVAGPGVPPAPGNERIRITTARELEDVLRALMPEHDALIMASAVADFRPSSRSQRKMRRGQSMSIALEPTPDILAALSRNRKKDQIIVGFALEDPDALVEGARAKLRAKGLDMVVANDTSSPASPEARFVLITRHETHDLGRLSKAKASFSIVQQMARLFQSGAKR